MPVLASDAWVPLTPADPLWQALIQTYPQVAQWRGRWYVLRDDPVRYLYPPSLSLPQAGDNQPLPVEFVFAGHYFRYEPEPRAPRPTSRWRRWGAAVAGVLVKLKALIVVVSLLLSMLAYGLAFGWAFGVGLVLIIAIHESGHVWANRRKGIPATLPVFIPFLGAIIQLKQFPQTAADEAFIGIMGPVFGLFASVAAFALGIVTGHSLFFALAEVGFLLHVFNLMPVLPLDGGRTVGFWRWKAWIPGMVGVLVILFYNPLTNQIRIDPFMIIIVALIIWSLVKEPPRHGPQYDSMPWQTRWGYTVVWAGLLFLSLVGYLGVGQWHPFA
jgi:Zn-dependent protease